MRPVLVLVLSCTLLAPRATAQDQIPPGIRAYLEAEPRLRAELISGQQQRLRQLVAEKKTQGDRIDGVRKSRTVQIKESRDRIERLKSGKEWPPQWLNGKKQLGQFGSISKVPEVVQILAPDEMVVRELSEPRGRVMSAEEAARSILEGGNGPSPRFERDRYILKGVSTDGLADGSDVTMPPFILVTDTNDVGSTLFVVQPVTAEQLAKYKAMLGKRRK